jgi:hypothetical protein
MRKGAGVALFALALQLVLSFGHVHLDRAALSGPALAGIAVSQAASDGGTPAAPGHHPDANDFCDICATIALTASLLMPQPAALVLPVAHAHRWASEFRPVVADSAPPVHFQARAPPVFS